jgi:hypothetical protein
MRSSDQVAASSFGSHWKYKRCSSGVRGADQGEPPVVPRIDQLLRGAFRLREDAEPSERVHVRIVRARSRGDGLAADSVESVAAGDEVAGDLALAASVAEADAGGFGVDSQHGGRRGAEAQLAPRAEPRRGQVLDDLVLRVEGDGLPAGERVQIDAVALAREAEEDPLVHRSFALHAVADAHLGEQMHRALLQHAGADRRFDLGPASRFEDDRFDLAQVEEMREQQTRGARPDDADLGTHAPLPPSLPGRCASEAQRAASTARVPGRPPPGVPAPGCAGRLP